MWPWSFYALAGITYLVVAGICLGRRWYILAGVMAFLGGFLLTHSMGEVL